MFQSKQSHLNRPKHNLFMSNPKTVSLSVTILEKIFCNSVLASQLGQIPPCHEDFFPETSEQGDEFRDLLLLCEINQQPFSKSGLHIHGGPRIMNINDDDLWRADFFSSRLLESAAIVEKDETNCIFQR